MTIKNKLDKLSDLKYYLEDVKIEKSKIIESIIPIDIQEKIKEVEEEFFSKENSLLETISQLEEDIKEEVILNGKSVKSDMMTASFVKGRITWNTDILEALSIVFPEVKSARKVGSPSVRISLNK